MIKLAKLDGLPEIFYSIQGEGRSIGKPSIFVRLSLCNLYCTWCDTDYTWNWEGTSFPHENDQLPGYKKFDKSDSMVALDDQELIENIGQYPCKNIIITGGEPMVQHKQLLPLLKTLKSKDASYTFEMETNGTLAPNDELHALIDQFNVSVKLSNSNVITKHRLVPSALKFFSASEKANFKFVVDNQQDMAEVHELIDQYNIPSSKIYLMPQGRTPEALQEKQFWLVEICKEFGFNYTDRLHIHIFGSKRGV